MIKILLFYVLRLSTVIWGSDNSLFDDFKGSNYYDSLQLNGMVDSSFELVDSS